MTMRTWSNPGCRVYWGTHGCHREHGHEGECECDCCDCDDHPDADSGCVAKPPYYGPETRFYGEDVAARGLLDLDVPIPRDCAHCGAHWLSTRGDVPDPCLGMLPGVWAACCGHGEGNGYIAFENGTIVRFDLAEVEGTTGK